MSDIMNEIKVISTDEKLDFSIFSKYSDTFIETGTAGGAGILNAIDSGFKIIKSVEAKDTYFNNCVEKFKDYDNVHLYFGMSQDKLKEMISDLDKPCVFWLDAHVSGPNSAGHEDYMEKGNNSDYAQDNVLTSELDIILNHRKDHIILIDDQDGLNPVSESYINKVFESNKDYQFYLYDEMRGDILYKNKCLVCMI